ncbi:uncharacterized protein [Apostichopus japonicus]|uniref:uncharacterized protein isoform X2 n=1 Tax=Stichopus japonicus TaxID=307972 RepID=UPI003AB4013C
MGTRNTNSLGWLASWLERHWRWFVTAAGLLILFVISTPMFVTDLLLVQIQAETNTSFIPPGDLLAGEMSAKFRSTGYWRTPLQITAGIYLAVLAPFSIFMSPKERRQGTAGQSFQQRKPRRSWATSVTLDSGRSDNESRLQRASSSDLSLDGSKASVRTNPPNGRLKTLSCSDCNTLLLFASVILPPMTWFVHWFGMETLWEEVSRPTASVNLLRNVGIASEIGAKLLIALTADRVDLPSKRIACFVIQCVLYVIVSFSELTIPDIAVTVPLTTVASAGVRGIFIVVAFSTVSRNMCSSHRRIQPITFTMVAIGIGYLTGFLLSVGVHVTTNALRHVFFLNILAYQLALIVIVAIPVKTNTQGGHRTLESRDSMSTDVVQLSVVIEEEHTEDPSTSYVTDIQDGALEKDFVLRRKPSSPW